MCIKRKSPSLKDQINQKTTTIVLSLIVLFYDNILIDSFYMWLCQRK